MPRSTSHTVALIATRYELVRELRVETETVDWEAFDTALDRRVVVQLLRPELAHDPLATERFWQAARAAARRPAAVGERVLDAGTDPDTDQRFVVREWPVLPAGATVGQPNPPRPAAITTLLRRPAIAGKFRHFEASPRWLVISGVIVVLALGVAVLRPAVEGWLAWVNTPFVRQDRSLGLAPPVAAPTTVASNARPAPQPTTVPTPVPTRAATATAVVEGQTRRVVNTDGRGVALRATPGGDRLPGKGYDEGATVQAFEQSGEFTRIRGADGREGWVLSVTLAP
jgi:hypothetical protein